MKAVDRIELMNLKIEAVIGIYPEERLRPQPLIADIRLHLDLSTAACTADLQASVDYADLARSVQYILAQAHFLLLESAAITLLRHILSSRPRRRGAIQDGISTASVKLKKPNALQGMGIPAIKMTRTRETLGDLSGSVGTLKLGGEASDFGPVLVLYDGPEATVLQTDASPPLSFRSDLSKSRTDWPLRGEVASPLPTAAGAWLTVVRKLQSVP